MEPTFLIELVYGIVARRIGSEVHCVTTASGDFVAEGVQQFPSNALSGCIRRDSQAAQESRFGESLGFLTTVAEGPQAPTNGECRMSQ